MAFKKDLTPLRKHGEVIKHKGKGSSAAPLPSRHTIKQLAQPGGATINNYAKATPMPSGQPAPAFSGLGSGDWPGNGI